ncbi:MULTISPECIES: GAF domain-containing protein [Nocardia]|uniref:GAF domain-containing protein n=1 Tax=Nocardia TaxID=1817 RepID=UPI000D68F834|nr:MULTISPECIES: GAF domain-containing protein [Nocardia]
MWGEWLLIECMRDEPTVLAIGRKPQRLQLLDRVLRNPTLQAARRLTVKVRETGHAWEENCADRHTHFVAEPVRNLAGDIHGVRIWTGSPDTHVPEAPRSSAFDWNLDAMTALLTEETYDLHAVAPDRRRPEISRASAMRWMAYAEDQGTVLALAAEADEHTVYHDIWQILRDDGVRRDVHFCARGAIVDGQRFARGLMIDISEGRDIPAPAPALTFSRAALEAELSVPGIHHALVDLDTLTAHHWLGAPMPGIAWELSDDPDRNPALHPDDIPTARAMARDLHTAPTTARLRLRNTDGGWTFVEVEAKRVLLTQNPDRAAALVSVSRTAANG